MKEQNLLPSIQTLPSGWGLFSLHVWTHGLQSWQLMCGIVKRVYLESMVGTKQTKRLALIFIHWFDRDPRPRLSGYSETVPCKKQFHWLDCDPPAFRPPQTPTLSLVTISTALILFMCFSLPQVNELLSRYVIYRETLFLSATTSLICSSVIYEGITNSRGPSLLCKI